MSLGYDVFVARLDENKKFQTLREHILNVAAQTENNIARFEWKTLGLIAGLLHDIGKYSAEFQYYIRLPDEERKGKRGSVNHSTAGAREAINLYGKQFGKLIAYIVAGHHSGLPDGEPRDAGDRSALKWRLDHAGSIPDYSAYRSEIELPPLDEKSLAQTIAPFVFRENPGFSLAFLVRMIFSALVDADRLDAERFSEPEKYRLRRSYPSLEQLRDALDRRLAQFDNAEKTPVNLLRAQVLQSCRSAAELEPGIFELTVPTGGGKTLSSMAFALNHAIKHGMERVIYVIPYTSIIEQNAKVFREAFGELGYAVVEHHSNFDPEKAHLEGEDLTRYELATENWDAPIIVTTNVQFFESLFDYHPSHCRKIHNIANSVVIFDEVQALPTEFLLPIIEAIRELADNYHTTVVLCTATQPALGRRPDFPGLDIKPDHKIIREPQRLYEQLKRVEYFNIGELSRNQLVERIAEHPQALCVVNTREDAKEIFLALKEKADEVFHLSARMCPRHRSEVLERIRERLKSGKRTLVVSTQLIEAGVDIDFPVVFRALAGLDSIIQAAGRCNREGKLPQKGKVFVFKLTDGGKQPSFLGIPTQTTEEIIRNFCDFTSLEAIEHYFKMVYWKRADKLDRDQILHRFNADWKELNFPFREVGQQFRLIEDGFYNSVVVPYDDAAERIINEIAEKRFADRDDIRKLQVYTVSLSDREFSAVKNMCSRIVDNLDIYVLHRDAYDEYLGVRLDNSDFDTDTMII